MDEQLQTLLPISNNSVSGRDLHTFMEIGKDFTNWMKDQIEAFGFLEHQDFEVFTEKGVNPQGGRPSKGYMLSISTAKELAMVQRTDKGKQARLYFIECERKAMEDRKPMTQIQMLLAQAQAMADQETKLNTLSAKVDAIATIQAQAALEMKTLPPACSEVPSLPTRAMLNRLVRDHALANALEFNSVWNRVYLEFKDRHHIDLKVRASNQGKKPLDVADELGLIEDMYSLACYLFLK